MSWRDKVFVRHKDYITLNSNGGRVRPIHSERIGKSDTYVLARATGSSSSVVDLTISLLSITIFIILLSRVFTGLVTNDFSNGLTFTSFLESLQNSPKVDMSWIFTFGAADLGWVGEIPLIGQALKLSQGILTILLFAFTGVTQVALFIGHWFSVLL